MVLIPTMQGLETVTGGAELLDAVGPLWEKLRDHHADASVSFRSSIAALPFARRRRSLETKGRSGAIRIDLLRSPAEKRDVAYCVTTITEDGMGEIESIWVEEDFRDRGIGDELLRRALAWLDERSVEKRIVSVVVGNERAFPFYARHGFHPRSTILEQLPQRAEGEDAER